MCWSWTVERFSLRERHRRGRERWSHRGPCCPPQRANSPSPPQRPRNQLENLTRWATAFFAPRATSRQQWRAERSEFAVGSNEPTVAEERKSRWASPNRDRRGTRRPTIRDAPKARPAGAIRPARTIEMTAVDISVVMYRVRQHQLPLCGRPGHSQWEIGLSDVANPRKPPGPGLRVTTARTAVMLKAAREPLPSG